MEALSRKKEPSSKALPPVSAGDIVGGKYRIENLLGCGAMAAVFAATHVGLGRRVAIKLLLPDMSQHGSVLERFAREARLAAQIQSRNVARVLDVGELSSGAPFMVMEYLEGTDLSGVLQARGPLPLSEVADSIVQACAGIAEAHALGIVHRDLKPANLFVTKGREGEPVVKVLDFGVAKALKGLLAPEPEFELTRTFDVVGSPHYMSPEQITCAKEVDGRADVWALGVVMYRLLTARPAFDGKSFAELCMSILQQAPRSLCELRPDVPLGFEMVLMRCLAKKPADRFQRMEDLAEALIPYLDATSFGASAVGLRRAERSGSIPSSSSNAAASWKSNAGIVTPELSVPPLRPPPVIVPHELFTPATPDGPTVLMPADRASALRDALVEQGAAVDVPHTFAQPSALEKRPERRKPILVTVGALTVVLAVVASGVLRSAPHTPAVPATSPVAVATAATARPAPAAPEPAIAEPVLAVSSRVPPEPAPSQGTPTTSSARRARYASPPAPARAPPVTSSRAPRNPLNIDLKDPN